MLDGAGPLGWDVTVPGPDKGGVAPGKARGKFCNRLYAQGGQPFTMTLKLGSVSLSAKSDACSACRDLPVGNNNITLYVESQAAGSGTLTIEGGKEYVFWVEVQGRTARLAGGYLDPSKGQTCESYKPGS